MEDGKLDKVIEGLNYCKEREGSCVSCPGNMECWCDEAIKLLKKQVPVKPEQERSGSGVTWWNVCGTCKTAINPNDKYCHECGQAVKWE